MVSNCTYENKNKIPKVSPAAPFKSTGRMTKDYEKCPNGQIALLKFIQEVIESGQHLDKVIWMNKEKSAFQFIDKPAFTVLYRVKFDNPTQKWDNIARLLRFNRAKGLISNVQNVQSAFSFNYPFEDIIEGRVIPNRSSPVSPKTPKLTGKNARATDKKELKDRTIGYRLNQNGTDFIAQIGSSQSFTTELSKPGRREATREEMRAIEGELLATLAPFDAFLDANKNIENLDINQKIRIYMDQALRSKNLPATQNLVSKCTQNASIEY